MKSSRQTEVTRKHSAQRLTDHSVATELTTAWKGLSQSKAALRHIENHLEAAPGSSVLLDSVMDLPKKKSSRTVRCREGQQADDKKGLSKHQGRSQQSPEKSSSRSPLRNTTQDSNVHRNHSVEFREPLASYREATPPPHHSSQLEACSLQAVPGSSYPSSSPLSGPLLSQRDTRDKQADKDLDSTYSLALESTDVRYLSDQPALDILRAVGHQSHLSGVRVPAEEESTPKAQHSMDSQHSSPLVATTPSLIRRGESTPSTSPGSASQRLENLRRHQPDDKLEKLKERIRRQRKHLEEAADREKLLGYLEQPIMAAVGSDNAGTNMPTAKIRKVAAAPPAPIYKGFNSTETKIQAPDGKVWKEEEFQHLSIKIYKDLSKQFAETTRSRHQQQREQRADRSKERRPSKPVRKVHRAAPSSELNAKPVISPASWREGQKLVKMVLGPGPKLPGQDRPQTADGLSRADPRPGSKTRLRTSSTERPTGGRGGQSKSNSTSTSTPLSAEREKVPAKISADILSADIQGIIDDLQLECKAAETEERARRRVRDGSSGRRGRGGSGSRTRTPFSAWGTTVTGGSSSRGCRSASPTVRQPEADDDADPGHKKRHYDADTVRQYISRQQEERRRRQAEEKRALREEAERRNQRLQELYRKQREMAKTVSLSSEVPVAPVQKRLQETYTKLLLEGAQLDREATQPAASYTQMRPLLPQRPLYQPSGESDKENKRLEPPQSPSSSDMSLNDLQPPPLSRNDFDVGIAPLRQPDRLNADIGPIASASSSVPGPGGDHLLSQLLRLESAVAAGDTQQVQRSASSNRSRSKISRIEALKATATSLSNRIEYEAQKIAGEGINYGVTTSMDVDTVLAPRTSQTNLDDGSWAQLCANDNNEMPLRIQGILTSTGHSLYNGTAPQGSGNLHSFRAQEEINRTCANLTNHQTNSAVVACPSPNSHTHDRRKLVNGCEKPERTDKMAQSREHGLTVDKNRTNLLDSSTESISEGPLLSEESFSEDDVPHFSSSCVPPADHLAAGDFFAGQRKDYQRLSEFQKEASKLSAFSSPFAQHNGTKPAWEELNKGSPLSVINIFTKNLQGHIKVSERNSPPAHSLPSGNSTLDAAVYEDDFVSSHSSQGSGQLKRSSNSHSRNSHFEELMKRSPYDKSKGGQNSHHSSFHSSVHSPHLSSGSPSGSSPFSKHSTGKRGTASDQSDATLVEEQRSSCSPPSEQLSSESRKRGSEKSSVHSQSKSVHSNVPSEKMSHKSLGTDSKKTSAARLKLASPPNSPDTGSAIASSSRGPNSVNTGTMAQSGRAEVRATGELQYSPAVLQQRLAAELHYLDSIEESVRQLGDMERLMGVSMAQQESASLAQMLQAKQQRHERDLYELKIKAEREALEMQLQMEENRQKLARAHIELQEGLAGAQKETLEGLQQTTMKLMSQQAEAAQYTADAARHIKEMTELARSQIAGALAPHPDAADSTGCEEQESSYSKQQQDNIDSDSFHSEVSSSHIKQEEPVASLNSSSHSHSDSLSFRRPDISVNGADSSSHHSPSRVSSDHSKRMKIDELEGKRRKGEAGEKQEVGSSSIEEEALTAANESLYSDNIRSVDEKGDSTSVATEYSLKFDESMTEDEIEERSFRSLLPSEAHRRGTKEKKSLHHEESEDDGAHSSKALICGAHKVLKSQDSVTAFSGGQESFSQFTMDMVRQYMKDEEVRLQHQSSLLHLRQKALKEKTKTELAWLEHQKKRLRDKGEDDKMPPIRKKQRGLLMKLQQEQAEIKRLQEANKAARKERQLLLKQQEEIERMRNTTFRLRERLKCAGGEPPPETPVSETPGSEASVLNMGQAEDVRSPSPSLSISGSETSSIMQKLKKMRFHMDEKFLTKREQQLMQRRHHAEELLQWKQRLDQEEAEVRRIEKEALAVWDKQKHQAKEIVDGQKAESPSPSHYQSSEPRPDSEKESVSEGDYSAVTPDSSIHTEPLGSKQTGSPSSVQPTSIPETPLASIQSSPVNYTHDFTSASQSHSRCIEYPQSPSKGSHSPAASPSDDSSKTKMQLRSASRTTNQALTQPKDSPMATQTEPISDQSDIESRIKALKEELKKRKFMAYQLKKEQKKRHKERLKAQEANLLKQLESYDNFIEKTKAELDKEPDSTADTGSQNKDSTSVAEHPSIKKSSHRSETSKITEKTKSDAVDHNDLSQVDHRRATSVPEESPEGSPTVTPSPSPGLKDCLSTEVFLRPSSKDAQIPESGDENIESYQRSDIQEELEIEVSPKSEDQHSEQLLKLDKEKRQDSQEKLSISKHVSSSASEEHHYSTSAHLEQDEVMKTGKPYQAGEFSESNIMPISTPHSAEMDCKIPPHSSYSPLSSNHSSKEEEHIQDVKLSSPTENCYHDDFESSVNSSPREKHYGYKPSSQISAFPTEMKGLRKDSPSNATTYDSQDEEIEEEIAEELSYHSGTSEASHLSGRLLDLHNKAEDSKHDSKDIVNSTHSPPSVLLQTSLPSVKDEMSSFNIGDRVLVGGVQPGTLKFKGPTSFANGFWAGVELDKSEGSNNGTYDGVAYFVCNERHGIFAPPDKITHLPDKFEVCTDTTEDDDSFFDDLPDKGADKHESNETKSQEERHLKSNDEQSSLKTCGSGNNNVTDESTHKTGSHINSQCNKESTHLISNGNTQNIILNFEDGPNNLFFSDMDKTGRLMGGQKEIITLDEKEVVDSQLHFTPADLAADRNEAEKQKEKDLLDTFADNFLNNFVKETVKQFAEIKKAKEQKIEADNQMNGAVINENVEEQEGFSSVEQKDGLPFFLPAEQELSSPELCNRPESPVFGASGQEELAKRLAELELNRELLDELGDDQDWFDEDFGLSSRREQQRLKQKEEEARRGGVGGDLGRSGVGVSLGGLVPSPGAEQQVKTPPRPELPLPLPPKLPEQPAMVVPHSATEVEKMVHAATQEIWESYGLGKEGAPTLSHLPNPKPSQEYLGKDAKSQDQEDLCIQSYKKAVYDLTWEILQEIYADDPNANQPLWVKPRQVMSSLYHKVRTPGNLTKTQEFIAAEVLKLYGLVKDHSQKTDWQKMLKFGRKKRDRVDHILVQELHEEEAQWVNYDEDELFVKMQLADSIFDSLLKDTANVLTLIHDKRAKRDNISSQLS